MERSPAPSDPAGPAELDTDTSTMDTVETQATAGARDADEVTSGRPSSSAARREPPGQPPASKWGSFFVRFRWTVILIAAFCLFIYWGHVPLMGMILGIQFLMVRELYTLSDKAHRSRHANGRGVVDDRRRAPRWFFFCVATFWMYLRFVQKQLVVELALNPTVAGLLGWLISRHSILAFALYCGGFVAFVLRLQKGLYLAQFRQYAWVHLILLFVFMPSSFFVSNIFDGIIWFLLPCSAVITNDIGAYLAGIIFGRTPLIKLSPKKTREGFFGGLLITLAASWLLADRMSRYRWLVCPRTDLSMGWLHCEPDELFKPKVFSAADVAGLLPARLAPLLAPLGRLLAAGAAALGWGNAADLTFVARPMQLHALVLALFASVIAPFGGFFASGFKRSFKIKDFGDSIPGHGGMTDRMDCQVVMAVFSYLYYNNYIAKGDATSVQSVMGAVMLLDPHARLELFQQLGSLLAQQQQLPAAARELLAAKKA